MSDIPENCTMVKLLIIQHTSTSPSYVLTEYSRVEVLGSTSIDHEGNRRLVDMRGASRTQPFGPTPYKGNNCKMGCVEATNPKSIATIPATGNAIGGARWACGLETRCSNATYANVNNMARGGDKERAKSNNHMIRAL